MAQSFLYTSRFRVTVAGCLAAAIIVQAGILWWLDYNMEFVAADSVISNVILLLACSLISHNLQFYQPAKGRYFYVVIWCLLLSAFWLFLDQLGLMYLLTNIDMDSFYKSLPVRFCIGFLTIGCVALVSIIWYSLKDQKENEQRKTDAEKLSREAELYRLRQQLQPHFLFNSLNSISALIGSKPEKAREMIYQLSDFLRGTLKKEENEWVTLSEEMNHLQLYLDIEKVRFGHRLSTEIEMNDICEKLRLPAMLLQPLVENAIKFGLYDTTDEVLIAIYVSTEDNNLIIKIQNPYDPTTAQPRRGTGFGLHGVKRRLYLLFARHDLLETQGEKNIFTTKVKVPQI